MRNKMNKYCYTTLLATEKYLYGVICLYYSLQKVKSKYPFIVMITDNIDKKTIDILNNIGIQYIIFPDNSFELEDNNLVRLRYSSTFNKFHFLTLPYEKIMFLDADVLIFNNIDYVFDNDTPAFWVLNKDFISGTYILMSPSKELFDTFLSMKNDYSTDEEILNAYYKPNDKIDKLSNVAISIFHESDFVLNNKKYWENFNITSPEQAYNLVNNNDKNEFLKKYDKVKTQQ